MKIGQVTSLDMSRGIFFGLTRYEDGILLVGRNIDMSNRTWLSQFPTNAIYTIGAPGPIGNPVLAHSCLIDLHQIRRIESWLCAVIGRTSNIAIFDLRDRQLVRTVDLLPFIPEALRRTDRPADPYHFNSLFFTKNRLFVLGHNWERPSFRFELSYVLSETGPDEFALAAVHENLGGSAHDIVLLDGTLHVLDSQNGRLMLLGETKRELAITSVKNPFPRGLSVTSDLIVVGYGCGRRKGSGGRAHRRG